MERKEEYTAPTLDIVSIDYTDVIQTSGCTDCDQANICLGNTCDTDCLMF